MKSAPGKVADKITAIAGRILSAGAGAVQNALTLGSRIADGVTSGIGDLGGKIASWILGHVHGAVSIHPSVKMGGPGGLVPVGFSWAKGGVTNGPQVTLIGEGKGREWVIPEDPAHRRNAMRLWMDAGHALGVPGMAGGGVAGRPSPNPYTSRFNWKRYKRASLDAESQQASDYDAETQRWVRFWQRGSTDGNLNAGQLATLIKRMRRYQSMLARMGGKAGLMARRDAKAAARQSDPQKKSELLQRASDERQRAHDAGQSVRDLTQDIADRIAERNGLLHPAKAPPTLDELLKRYDDLDALIQAGLGPKGMSEQTLLGNELTYLRSLAKHPPKGVALPDIARSIVDVQGRLDALNASSGAGGTGTSPDQPIQAQIDAATNAGFASGFGRMWDGLTRGIGDIGTGQGVTLAVDRLLISPAPANYQAMADGANAGNDAQSFRIYNPAQTVGVPT